MNVIIKEMTTQNNYLVVQEMSVQKKLVIKHQEKITMDMMILGLKKDLETTQRKKMQLYILQKKLIIKNIMQLENGILVLKVEELLAKIIFSMIHIIQA